MGPLLLDYDQQARASIRLFWGNRGQSARRQADLAGVETDGGERIRTDNRAAVTGGKNMDGFVHLLRDIVRANGLGHADIHVNKGDVTLPGYYRPTKQWDFVVRLGGRLVVAIELKSQVGSLGNNYNNRLEEAVGSGLDLVRAHEVGLFGRGVPKPFMGWLVLLGDEPGARTAVRDASRHFPIMPVFQDASYWRRYEVLCRMLVADGLYDATCALLSPPSAVDDGHYEEASPDTGLQQFLAKLANHCLQAAAWS